MMNPKQITAVLAALALCAAMAACAQPGSGESPAPAGESGPGSSAAQPAAESGSGPESEPQEAEPMEPFYVADAALYRGTVTSIDTTLSGETLYKLEAYPGSGLQEQLLAVPTGDTKASFDFSTVALGDHLEVFYGAPPAGEETCGLTCYDIIAVNRLLPAEAVYYNGILVKAEEREDGSLDLVMVPEDTAQPDWEDPMKQFIFHTGEDTQFYMNEADLISGAHLNLYHRGIMTMSIPPQGGALEVRPIIAVCGVE